MHRLETEVTTTEPVTLGETKAFARIEHDDDDALISALIATARKVAESFTLNRFVRHDFTLTYDRIEVCEILELEMQTVIASVGAFDVTDSDDAEVAGVQNTDFRISNNRLVLDLTTDLFNNMREFDALKLSYVTSFEVGEQPIKDAINMIVAHLYENREAISEFNAVEIPMGPASILSQYKHYSV